MKSHFVCAVIWRINPDNGQMEFLVIDSQSINPQTDQLSEFQTKFPGGMNRLDDEPVMVTLQREILEETYLTCSSTYSKEIWRKQLGEHTKYGFLIGYGSCRGDFRPGVLEDGNDVLSPPRWVAARTLGRDLFHRHQEVYLAAYRELDITITF